MHTNSELLFKKYAKSYFKSSLKVLEIGPDAFPSSFRTFVSDDSLIWHTLDIDDKEHLTYPRSPEHSFPIQDNSYDIILSGQVIEHVRKIWLWIKELERVCVVGGYIIIISPISWPYHGAPIDCWRIYPEGMKALLDETKLSIIDCHFESLEIARYRRYIPGKSQMYQSWKRRLFYRVMGFFGCPVEVSYDLITIAQKTG